MKKMYLFYLVLMSMQVIAQEKNAVPEQGYFTLFLSSVGKTVKVDDATYYKTNGQFVDVNLNYRLTGDLVALYLRVSDSTGQVDTMRVARIQNRLLSQPKVNPFVSFARIASKKTTRKLKRDDDAKVTLAYIIENSDDSTMTLDQFREWQVKIQPVSAPQYEGAKKVSDFAPIVTPAVIKKQVAAPATKKEKDLKSENPYD